MLPYSRFRGYHYILTVIDVLSKYAWAIPLKNVQTLMKKHTINHYSTYSVMKASIVKRFKRTLKNDMWKQFTLNGTYKWIDIFPHLLMEYNARKHRTIGMRSINVTPAIADKLLTTVYSNVKIAGSARFEVDDPIHADNLLLEDSTNTNCIALHIQTLISWRKYYARKVYVKWLRLDKSYNSWIDKTNVL
ncbi:uncharacterized protein LOC109862805 [Pseudomyrmex gracilis]|uniref:uncharacterized protein LOC109862805 n=1 Tax=Pseudomyrmex gracilis TaxID=219809 RepID=UPI000994BB15|nr:uncharacterized protein LOC109862805 [Pseudomyrmex gracilis]